MASVSTPLVPAAPPGAVQHLHLPRLHVEVADAVRSLRLDGAGAGLGDPAPALAVMFPLIVSVEACRATMSCVLLARCTLRRSCGCRSPTKMLRRLPGRRQRELPGAAERVAVGVVEDEAADGVVAVDVDRLRRGDAVEEGDGDVGGVGNGDVPLAGVVPVPAAVAVPLSEARRPMSSGGRSLSAVDDQVAFDEQVHAEDAGDGTRSRRAGRGCRGR